MRPLKESPVTGTVPRYEIPLWRERYGVVAGITARGTDPTLSPRGFDLGLWTAAPVGDVMGRWRQFRSSEPGFSGWILGHQVHGTRVAWHEGASGWCLLEGLDGHATATSGLMLLVTVADCVPIYLVAPRQRVVALLHAGWRGTAGGILNRGLQLLQTHGVSPADLVMHCGVAICGPCYEVGAEVITGCGLEAKGAGPWHLDLRQRLGEQALALGVTDISTSQWCSGHDRPPFYSHRASGGADGRMVAYLGIPHSAAGGNPL